MYLKNVNKLKDILLSEGYDLILIRNSGYWDLVSSNFVAGQEDSNIIRYIRRTENTNLTYKQINDLIKDLETELDRLDAMWTSYHEELNATTYEEDEEVPEFFSKDNSYFGSKSVNLENCIYD